MQQVLILIGISGSGKSTWAGQFVQANPTYLRLNRDDLRRSLLAVPLSQYWTWETAAKNRIERLVTILFDTAFGAALAHGWDLVLDNTHLNRTYLTELLRVVKAYSTPARPVTVTYRLVDTPLQTAIDRDRPRPDGVGEAVIREQHRRLQSLKKQVDLGQKIVYPLPTIG